MRVTDLEKFALEEVWWPYQTLAGREEARLTRLPMSLDETADKLKAGGEWAHCVLDRIFRIGVTFPAYIKHPLVDVIREYGASHE